MSYFLNKLPRANPRCSVVSRVLAAVFGGYAFATSMSLLMTQCLRLVTTENQAIHSGLLLSFIVYAAVVMWVFAVTTAKKAWFGLITANALALLATLVLMQVTHG